MLSSEGDNDKKEKSNEVRTATSWMLLELVHHDGVIDGHYFDLPRCQRIRMAHRHYTFWFVLVRLKIPLLLNN